MNKFFELNGEGKIGYKNLTDADLRRRETSHQTHIGLFDDVLTFLPNKVEIPDALLVYNDDCDELPVCFDRIQRANGEYNSPKIKSGGQGTISIASQIVQIAKSENVSLKWFLLWFGLKSEQPVFFLFHNQSDSYTKLTELGVDLSDGVKNRMTTNTAVFRSVLSFLEEIVNKNGEGIIRRTEEAAQVGLTQFTQGRTLRPIRRYNIDKANKRQKIIGQKGEELVNRYLKSCQQNGTINKYNWFNENGRESGLPYDFSIEENDGNIKFLDVKSTDGVFDRNICFSNQEISFISETMNSYEIFRVYDMLSAPKLRICKDYKPYANRIKEVINDFGSSLYGLNADMQSIKLLVPTIHQDYTFEQDIVLHD